MKLRNATLALLVIAGATTASAQGTGSGSTDPILPPQPAGCQWTGVDNFITTIPHVFQGRFPNNGQVTVYNANGGAVNVTTRLICVNNFNNGSGPCGTHQTSTWSNLDTIPCFFPTVVVPGFGTYSIDLDFGTAPPLCAGDMRVDVVVTGGIIGGSNGMVPIVEMTWFDEVGHISSGAHYRMARRSCGQ